MIFKILIQAAAVAVIFTAIVFVIAVVALALNAI